ncbi:hypothetical protein ALMP_43240 [Streptomyces sp. A012304]|nr:hypothetical protein ALMP_43240 [Streptomyces sp. A012304]
MQVVRDVVLSPHLTEYVETVRTRPPHVVVPAPSAEAVAARAAARARTGHGAGWTVAALDTELRTRPPRVSDCGWTPRSRRVGETVEAIPAGRQRARVV